MSVLRRMRRHRAFVTFGALIAAAIWALVASGCSTGATTTGTTQASTTTASVAATEAAAVSANSSQAEYAAAWSRAWTDAAVWTRLSAIAIADDSPDAPFAITRLDRAPSDMAVLMTPYYGASKAGYFNELMSTHFDATVALVQAMHSGSATQTADAEKSLYASAADITIYLGQIDPSIDQTSTSDAFKKYIVLTKQQATDRLAKRWSADVGDFDAVEGQALRLSDMLSSSVMVQFPDKFQ